MVVANKKEKKINRITGTQIKKFRKDLNISQIVFWNAILVAQSTGSRYENGRAIPFQVEILIRVIHLQQKVDDAIKSVVINHVKNSAFYVIGNSKDKLKAFMDLRKLLGIKKFNFEFS